MKNRLLWLWPMLLLLLLSSCKFPPEYVSKAKIAEKIEEIMAVIQSGEKEQLLGYFSEKVRNEHYDTLLSQIDMMYTNIGGGITSYGKPQHCGYTYEFVEYGDIKLYESVPIVKDVQTKAGGVVEVVFCYTVIDDKEPENVGIRKIDICWQQQDGTYGKADIEIDGVIGKESER